MGQELREKLEMEHFKYNRNWFSEETERLGARWLLLGADTGIPYKHGVNLLDTPSPDEVKKLEKEKGEILFLWEEAPIVDDRREQRV